MGEPVLLTYLHEPDQGELQAYSARGGYEGLRRALSMPPEAVTDEVDKSGLRGRGGAGFPTGRKWKFIPKDPAVTKYVVVNADEGEPGTFKDRTLLEGDPHRLIEGIVIASYAVGAHLAFIYLRREFYHAREMLERALAQAAAAGMGRGRKFKACFPGGSSSAILPAAYLDTPMDYDALAKLDVYGSMLGSGALIAMDDTTCMVEVVARTVEFYRDESCGKCTPCREGTMWLGQALHRMLGGKGRVEDLPLLEGIARGMTGTCFCPLGESVPPAIYSTLRFFRHEYEHHAKTGTCDITEAMHA